MSTKYDAVVFIGRFQPFHNAHLETIINAFEQAKKVIILIGSAFQPRTYKNPFFEWERALHISNSLTGLGFNENKDFFIRYIQDYTYDNSKWVKAVNSQVVQITNSTNKIALIGHKKDKSSFYLDMFPNWEMIELPLLQNLSSQDIRELYFQENSNLNFLKGVLPYYVQQSLKEFQLLPPFMEIVRERIYIEKYKAPYKFLPYPPIFVTADAVVFAENYRYVLLIKRKYEPGKGLYALPGGFVDADNDSSVFSASLRELKEEVGLELSENDVVDENVFDAIGRSSRGRVITHAYTFDLSKLREIVGTSDALSAEWVPISAIKSKRRDFFEDHFDIIRTCFCHIQQSHVLNTTNLQTMTYSKIHQAFSEHLKTPDVLKNPEKYLGPNFEKVLDFWIYLDTLSNKEKKEMAQSYWALDEEVRNSAFVAAWDAAAEVIGVGFREAAWWAADVVTGKGVFGVATVELIAHHKLLEQNKTPTILPLCVKP
jgi:bifunctional NMN adenylyltransferase/nudix hydrolase